MKKISFSDVCDLTACVLRGEVTIKVVPVTMTLHEELASGELRKASPDDMTFYFSKSGWFLAKYNGKDYTVPRQNLPAYKIGEKVAISQCLKDLGYDANEKSNGHIYGLCHTPAWTMKSHVSAHQCKNFVRITGMKVKRLQEITDEEILHSGVYRWQDMPDCPKLTKESDRILYGFYKFWDGYETPRKAYASMIDKTQKKGFWESNPWVIMYKFELTKEE